MVERNQGVPQATRWMRIARRAVTEFRKDKVTLISSGVAFRVALATFPAIGILVWLASHFISADQVYSALQSAAEALPDSTRDIVGQAIEAARTNSLSSGNASSPLDVAGPLLSLVIALWSANSGVRALFIGLNTIFNRTEGRGFVRHLLVTLAFTAGALTMSLFGIALIAIGPDLLSQIGTSDLWLTAWRYLRWVLLFVVSLVGLSTLYAYAPNRERGETSFLTLGGLLASLAFTGAAATFSSFIQHFARLPLTYGSLSTFIAFMIWLWLSFTLVLAGAELDSAIESERDGPCQNVDEPQMRERGH